METCYVNENFIKERFIDTKPEATIKNAKIESIDVKLFRSYLMLFIHFSYGSAFQGYTSPTLTGTSPDGKTWTDTGAGNFISNIIRLFGDGEEIDLQSLKGKPCKVLSDFSGVYAIGDFLEDRWFCPDYYYELLKNR